MKKMLNLSVLFAELETLFEPYKNVFTITKTINTSGDVEKPTIQMVDKKDVAILGRKAQPTWIAGLIQQKNFVGFYLMSMYTHPQLVTINNPAVAKTKKGKSCFNLTSITPEMLSELTRLLQLSVEIYQQNGWV